MWKTNWQFSRKQSVKSNFLSFQLKAFFVLSLHFRSAFLYFSISLYPSRYLRDNFKIIDPTKICAYGWGYGAYLTSILLTKDSKRTFLCYIAVAPIVSFQFYSKSLLSTHKLIHFADVDTFIGSGSFFTEKYFGYNRMIGHSLQEADLSLRADNFLLKNYLLIHGTADTLVHQQHTMLLTKSLIQKGVIFRHQVGQTT